jgi:aryl-alcohol dehydrogenase-like predicted oxidoreductase
MAHDFDPDVAQEETLSAFARLRENGKIGAVGASNFSAEQIAEALELAHLEGLPRYDVVQNSFSLLEQRDRETVFPLCHEHGLAYEPFSALAGGWLTGKYRRDADPPAGSRMTTRPEPYESYRADRVYDALEALEAHARMRGVSMAGLALAWALAVPEVTAVVVGPGREDHLEPVREALEIELASEDVSTIEAWFA